MKLNIEDMIKKLEQEVQKVTDEFVKNIDDICVEKEKEISKESIQGKR